MKLPGNCSPQSKSRNNKNLEYSLDCVAKFDSKITHIEFGPFKLHDQKLKLIFTTGKSVDLYFNTSTELVDFFDFLVGLKVSTGPGPDENRRHVFVPLNKADNLPGWINGMDVRY